VDANVPRDLLPVAGRILAVRALVQPLAAVRAEVLLQHQLMAARKLTGAALEGLVLRRAVLVVAQKVLR